MRRSGAEPLQPMQHLMSNCGALRQSASGTRAVAEGTRRWNETFLWTPERGLVRGRAKALLPQQEGGWEETWFDRGSQDAVPVRDGALCFSELVCTELMVSTAARRLGRSGVQVIAAPRATGAHPRWEVAARMNAIAAGAYVATANRRGATLAGGAGSWRRTATSSHARTRVSRSSVWRSISASVDEGTADLSA